MHRFGTCNSIGMATLLVAIVAMGCGKKDKDKPGESASNTAGAAKAGGDKGAATKVEPVTGKVAGMAKAGLNKIEGVAAVKDTAGALANKDGKPLTAEEYEKMILSLAACGIKERSIDRECPEYKAFNAAKKNRKNALAKMGGQMAAIGQKLMGHENATVRLYAASTMNSFFGASNNTIKTVLDFGPKETNPAVLRTLVDAVGSKMKKDPAVAKFVIGLAEHESPMVRIEVASWLTSTWSDGVAGSLERAMKMVESDKDPKVRGYACSRLGRKVDERALVTLKKYTKDKAGEAEPELHGRCLEGLAEMFMQWPFADKTSKKAFDLFTQRISSGKCSKKVPAWTVMSRLEYMAKPEYAKKTPWFPGKKAQLMKALTKAAECSEGGWMARTRALGLMKKLGADKAAFQKIHKKLLPNKDKGENSSVLRDLEKLM